MLGLLHPTDPSWVAAAERDLDGLLSDHAHCEMKAAQSALSLVGRFGGEAPELGAPLCALAHEEIEHFERVRHKLADRRATLGAPSSDGYVTALRAAALVRDEGEPASPRLLDRLLVAALIEARSCERFRLLADKLQSMELRSFYRDLMASEARHFRLFAGLAETRFGQEDARARLITLAAREAQIAARLPLGPTVHG